MSTYITLSKFTNDAKKAIRQNPDKDLLPKKTGEETCAKILFQFATLGPYDLITIFEAPDKKTVSEVINQISNNGDINSVTTAAIDLNQFTKAYASCFFFRSINKNGERPGNFSCQCNLTECFGRTTKCIK